MKILLIHQNMPGQYKHIAKELAKDPNNEVVFITKEGRPDIEGVKKVEFRVTGDVDKGTHKYLINITRAILQGQEVWRVCNKLKQSGFKPDVICAHPGWGDALFIKEIFGDVPLLNYAEFYYRPFGADMHFDPKDKVEPDNLARVRIKNTNNLINLEACDWGISPTFWQWSQNPKGLREKISVLHEGIDTNHVAPTEISEMQVNDSLHIHKDEEIVTYVARNFEPYRGFPTVMRAFEILQKQRPNAKIIVIGSDGVSYGKGLPQGMTYKKQMLEELSLDMERIHFVGSLPYEKMLDVLRLSSAHIYLTYPFVLSWSMLESMSLGCAMICSDTSPVQEVIEDGVNGLMVDFFSPEDVAAKVSQVLDHPDRMQNMRQAARQTVLDKYALEKLLPMHIALIKDVAKGVFPPEAAKTIDAFNAKHSLGLKFNEAA
ncbi:MAG: glycosyltransferase family 4 protein [Rickettsiales bacterium]|nr:glycosyltransferase family 4 protein [Rickettsiales bacterium]